MDVNVKSVCARANWSADSKKLFYESTAKLQSLLPSCCMVNDVCTHSEHRSMINSFAEKIATVLSESSCKQHYVKQNACKKSFEWTEQLRRLKNTVRVHQHEWLCNGRLIFGVIFDARQKSRL